MISARPLLSSEEVCRRGQEIYEAKIRTQVESEENIGKIISIDIETGDYEIDDVGIESARRLQAKHPGAAIYGARIGFDAAYSLGGVLSRTMVATSR